MLCFSVFLLASPIDFNTGDSDVTTLISLFRFRDTNQKHLTGFISKYSVTNIFLFLLNQAHHKTFHFFKIIMEYMHSELLID